MAVNRVPILKRCRSLGLDPVYLGVDKKSNRELKRANRKISEYGLQLREKQKAKFIYGVLEKPFHNYYEKADKMMGLARTRRESRQIVNHKFITVNGKCVSVPSYLIKAGDVIQVREKSRGLQRFKDIIEVTGGRLVPEWIDMDADGLGGTIKELPTREQIDVPVDEMLIVELYSK